MPGFVVTAVFEVDGAAIRPGRDVLAGGDDLGHRFSYYDGHVLVLVAEVQDVDRYAAFEAVLSAAERRWTALTATALPLPARLRVEDVAERAVPGRVGRGPDRLFAESAARTAACLRATRAALACLAGPGTDQDPADGPPGPGASAQTRSTRSAMESAIMDGRKG